MKTKSEENRVNVNIFSSKSMSMNSVYNFM